MTPHTTAFAQLISLCGLSQLEAAEYLEHGLSKIKKWGSYAATIERSAPPRDVWQRLAQLHAHIDQVAVDHYPMLKQAHNSGKKIDQNCFISIEADDPINPLPPAAKKAAGARALAMFLAVLDDEEIGKIIGK